MDRRIDWIVRNGALAAALYFAMVVHVDWLKYVVAGFVGWTLVRNVWTLQELSLLRSGTPAAARQASTMAFDLAVLASMFLAHWYWIAFAYALSCGCLAMAQARATSKP